jgi:hypothetical protein
VQGATIQLLLADGKIAVAQCDSKPDIGRNLTLAFAQIPASPTYRSCRTPDTNSVVEVEFSQHEGWVKIHMQYETPDGRLHWTQETYKVMGWMSPSSAPAVTSQIASVQVAPTSSALIPRAPYTGTAAAAPATSGAPTGQYPSVRSSADCE